MKAIIIEEERFIEILDKLTLENEALAIKSEHPDVVRETYRKLHFYLSSWMQGQGARLSK